MSVFGSAVLSEDNTSAQAVDTSPGQFRQGLRSGLSGAYSQLQSFAGGAGEALGFDDFAQGRYADAREAQADAQANAPRIDSYTKVNNLRDAYDYATGLLGQSIPQSVAAVGGALVGRTPVGRVIGAAGAQLPFEAGDVVQRQQNDPVSLRTPADERFGQALATGGASALAQGVVPGIVTGKVLGPIAGTVRPTMRTSLRNAGLMVAGEGAAETAGEALKQGGVMLSNPDRPLDTQALKEAAVGGAVAGAPFAGASVAADAGRAVTEAAKTPGNVLSGAVDAVKEGAASLGTKISGKAQETADKAAAAVPEKGGDPDPVAALKGIYDRTAEQARGFWDRVAQQEDVADLTKAAGKTAEQIKEMLPQIDAERIDRVAEAANELLAKAGLDDARKAQVAEAARDLTNRANQAVVAATKRGVEVTEAFGKKAEELLKAFPEFQASINEKAREAGRATGRAIKERMAKKSEDFSGIRAAIASELVPVLQRSNPGIFEDSDALKTAADGVRMAVEAYKSGQTPTSTQVARLIDTFGDEAVNVLDATFRVMGQASPEESEAFYGALNELRAQKKDEDKTLGLMMRSLLPELQEVVRMPELRQELQILRDAITRLDQNSQQGRFKMETLRFDLDTRYGKNADKILEAIEKELTQKRSVTEDAPSKSLAREAADGAMGDATLGNAIPYGPEKGGLALHPKHDDPVKGQAIQAAARARKAHPDRFVRFLTAEELGMDHPEVQQQLKTLSTEFTKAGMEPEEADRLAREEVKKYGMTVAEGTPDAGILSKSDLKKITVKGEGEAKAKSSHYQNPAVFKVGNTSYDAIKLTQLMHQQFKEEFNDADDRSAINRNARMFLTGIAALQDALGETFALDPKLVIDHKGTTVARIRKLDLTPRMKGEGGEHATAEDLRKEFEALRAEHRDLVNALDDDDGSLSKEQVREMSDRIAKLEELVPKIRERAVAADRSERIARVLEQEGQYEADPRGPIHLLDKPEQIVTNETGNSRAEDERFRDAKLKERKDKPVADEETVAKSGPVKTSSEILREKFHSWVTNPPSAAAKVIGTRGIWLIDNKDRLNGAAKKSLIALLGPNMKASQVASTVNGLYEKYAGKDVPKVPEAKAKPSSIDADFTKTKFPEFKNRSEVSVYLVDAYRRWGELRDKERRILNDENHPTNELERDEALAFYALGHYFEDDSVQDLGSFYDGIAEIDDTKVRAMLRKAAPEVAAKGPKGSMVSATRPGGWKGSDPEIQDVLRYIGKVLGPAAQTSLARIPHAGEYVNDVIRISVYALDPKSVAYHEALHAFFAKLIDQGNSNVAGVLKKAASSAAVQRQLRALLKGEDAALAQLSDPEEAAAYMYQFWALGRIDLGPATQSLFARIRDAVLKVLGIWSTSRRAEAIMGYFHSGDFATQGMGKPNAVAKALMEPGRNAALEKVRTFTQPLTDLVDALAFSSGERLRDTGIPALRELADLMKATGRAATKDPGFIPAARTERSRVLNAFAARMRGYTQAQLDDALKGLQTASAPASPEGRLIAREVKQLLADMLGYMQVSGVDTSIWVSNKTASGKITWEKVQIMENPDYFPRKYDAVAISKDRAGFEALLQKYGLSKDAAEETTLMLAATDGAELTLEVDRPGHTSLRARRFGHIPDAELEPYMSKDLFEIIDSYVTQATRRAEWAKRIGDDPKSLSLRMMNAKAQGATDQQIESAWKVVRAVDGTIGDSLDPRARRIMGDVTVYQNIRLLPLAIFSSIVDPLGVAVRGGTLRDSWETFKRGVKDLRHAWSGQYPQDPDADLAELIGTIDNAMLLNTTAGLYTQGMVGNTAKKWNTMFFRLNFMEGFNRSMRIGATKAAIRFLEHHRDGKASEHSVRWLAELGLKPGFTMDVNDPKVKAAINMWVDGAVLRPDATDKPVWMSDPHFMLIAHLKQFTYAFQETILKRVMHEYSNGNYAPAMVLTSYVPVMIAADLTKGLLTNGGELPEWKKDWTLADHVAEGVQRAGLAGLLGAEPYSFGPTIEQVYDWVKAIETGRGLEHEAVRALPANALYR